MKLLITGATGFLGRQVLSLLVGDDRIQEIWVTSRTKKSHPHSKVQMLRLDLSDPAQLAGLERRPDAVIHLAGLYDFRQSYENCYTQNVLASLHLAQKIKQWNTKGSVPLYFASTYAVGFGRGAENSESPLVDLPSRSIPYAFTKALAERAITDAGIPCAIFRLGILVGTSSDGAVDKLDGAYAFVRLVEQIGRLPALLPFLPLPGNPEGILPLVPVDYAARVFHEALHRPETASNPARIYGVYDANSVRVRDFCESLIGEMAPGKLGFYVDHLPEIVLKLQSSVTPVPADAFKFALNPVPLKNPAFQSEFPGLTIPRFSEYQKAFYQGYRRRRGAPS